jgi:hypothetical protein
MRRLLLVAAVSAALTLSPTAAATAAEPDLDPDVAHALDALPGGVLVDESTVQWPRLGMTLTVAAESVLSVGTCSTGYVCAYSGSNRTGSRLSFAGCSVWSTAALPSVGSVANARTSGWVNARNASGASIAYAGYGMSVNTPAGVTSIACAGDGVTF